MTRFRCIALLCLALALTCGVPSAGAQTVTVTVPAGVSFNVRDVSAATAGTPGSTQVSFSTPVGFLSNNRLKVSVRADATTFTGPGTTRIGASQVSWTATTSSGTASSGTLASSSYTEVYRSVNGLQLTSTGAVNLQWTLAPIAAAGLRSGTHTLTVRWKFEVI